MDQNEFNERAARLQEVGKVIEKLPSEIRNDAFTLLKEYVSPKTIAPPGQADDESDTVASGGGLADLLSRFDHDKPSDNVRLIAASLFREYGSEEFSADELKAIAANAGVTVPDRVDMTLAQAKENGKHLFTRTGRGKFKPTVHGEAHLKTTYGVRKGTKKREAEE